MFIYNSFTVYVNGQIVEEEWGWDVETMSYIDVVEVYVDEWVFDKSEKKLNDFKGDEVVVIDGVEAKAVVEGEDEIEVQVEAEVLFDEQGLVEVQVQGEDEAGVLGEMEVVVEGVMEDDVGAEEDDDDDSSNCSEVSDSDFEESSDWTEWLDPKTFSQSSDPTFDTNKVELTNFDFDDEVGYSDELDTLGGNEDEGPPKVIFPCFKVPENDEDVKFEVRLSSLRNKF